MVEASTRISRPNLHAVHHPHLDAWSQDMSAELSALFARLAIDCGIS